MDRMDGRHRGCVWGFQCIVRKEDVGVWKNVGAVVCASGRKESGGYCFRVSWIDCFCATVAESGWLGCWGVWCTRAKGGICFLGCRRCR
jgi:hypothetical protein